MKKTIQLNLSTIISKANKPLFADEKGVFCMKQMESFMYHSHLDSWVTFVPSDEEYDKSKNYVQTYWVNDKWEITLGGEKANLDQVYVTIEDLVSPEEIVAELQKVAKYNDIIELKDFIKGLSATPKYREIENIVFNIPAGQIPQYLQDARYDKTKNHVPIVPLIINYLRQQKIKKYYDKLKDTDKYHYALAKDTIVSTTPIARADLETDDQTQFQNSLHLRQITFWQQDTDKPLTPKHIVHIPKNITKVQMLGILLDIQDKYPDDPKLSRYIDDLRSSAQIGSVHHTIADIQKDIIKVFLLSRDEKNPKTGKEKAIQYAKDTLWKDFVKMLESQLSSKHINKLFMPHRKTIVQVKRELQEILSDKTGQYETTKIIPKIQEQTEISSDSDQGQLVFPRLMRIFKKKQKKTPFSDLISQLESGITQKLDIDVLYLGYKDAIERAMKELRTYMLTGKSQGTMIRQVMQNIFGDDVGEVITKSTITLHEKLWLEKKAEVLKKKKTKMESYYQEYKRIKEPSLEDEHIMQSAIDDLAKTELEYTDEIMNTIYTQYQYSKTNSNKYTSTGNHLLATQEMVCTGFALLTTSCLTGMGLTCYGASMDWHSTNAVHLINGETWMIDSTRWKKWQIKNTIDRQDGWAVIQAQDISMYRNKHSISLTTDPIAGILSNVVSNTADPLPPGKEQQQIILNTLALQANPNSSATYNNRWSTFEELSKKESDTIKKSEYRLACARDRFIAGLLSNTNSSYREERRWRAKKDWRDHLSDTEKTTQIADNSPLYQEFVKITQQPWRAWPDIDTIRSTFEKEIAWIEKKSRKQTIKGFFRKF